MSRIGARTVQVVKDPDGWVEIAVHTRDDNGWRTKSVRLSPDEFASLGKEGSPR